MFTADQIARECSDLLLRDVAPQQPGERLKEWLYRAAVMTGLTQRYVKKLRYQEVPVVPAHVAFIIHDLAARQRATRARIEAQRIKNDHLLAEARKGMPLDGLYVGGNGAVVQPSSDEDPRQLALPLSGWRR